MTTHATPDLRREDAIGTPPQRPTLVPAERYYSASTRVGRCGGVPIASSRRRSGVAWVVIEVLPKPL